MRKLRIFISSPGDVGRERGTASRVLARLRAECAGRIEIEPYFWEHEPMQAGADFQGQIPPAAEFSIFIGILWSRLGTRLNRRHRRADGTAYESGTAYEFETALEAYRQSSEKTPRVLIYRRSEIPSFPAEPRELFEERQRQWNLLKGFIERSFTDQTDGGTFKAAFNTYANTADFEERLDAHLHTLVRELAGDALTSAALDATPAPTWLHGSPYRGLKVFEFEHAPLFFGRTREADAVVGQLRDRANEEGCPFVLIFGSSGSGKSSLLRAGVIPLLVAGGVDGLGFWRRALLRPSQSAGDLFDGLAGALLQAEAMPELGAGGRDARELARLLRENAASVGAMIATALPLIAERQHDAEKQRLTAQAEACEREGRAADAESIRQLLAVLRAPAPRLILGLDQLEELFTHEDRFPAAQREAFIRAISSLVHSQFVWVVATLRSDFFPRCEGLGELMTLKAGKGEFHVVPPDSTQLRQMIRLPAQAAGVRFEDDPVRGRLDDVLHDAAMSEAGSLPLLSFALDQLFQIGAADRLLAHREYEQLGGGEQGGLRGVLVQMADETYRLLSPAAHACFLPVFKRLVTIEANATAKEPFSRRAAPLASATSDPGEREVVETFLQARLLVADSDAGGEEIVTVAHEALLNQWPRLREMLGRERGYLRRRARLAANAAEWHREGRDPQRLAQGVALAEAREINATEGRSLGGIEREYAVRSLRRHRRRTVRLLAGAAGLVVIFAVLAVWAALAAREAEHLLSVSLFTRAQQLFEKEEAPSAIAVLADAIDLDPSGAFEAGERLYFALTQRAWPRALSAEMKHHGAINTACFSPDGKQVLTASQDSSAQLWDAESGAPIGEAMVHEKAVRAAWFSPDGRHVVTACLDAKARLWNPAAARAVPVAILGHGKQISAAAFSAGGQFVATGAQDATAAVWAVATGARLAELSHEGNVHTLAFHPTDEQRLLTVSARTARLWKLPAGGEPLSFKHDEEIRSARFDPSGDRVITCGADGAVRVWNSATGQPVGQPLKADALTSEMSVGDAAFSPDGALIAASAGPFVFLWKADGSILRKTPLECGARVLCMRFSPDGGRLLAGTDDGRLQIWNALTGEKIGEAIRANGAIVATDFSRDGKRVLLGTRAGVARVWMPPASLRLSDRLSQGAGIEAIALSPDGRQLVVGCSDGQARRWDTAKHSLITPALAHQTAVLSVAFSPDGKFIVTGSADPTARIWQAASGAALGEPLAHDGDVRLVRCNPDGQSFATATYSGTARLWKLPSGIPLGAPITHRAEVSGLSFNQDGTLLLTTSSDFTAKVSSAVTGESKLPPINADGALRCGAFARTGKFATGSDDGSAQIRDAAGKPQFDRLRHQDAIVALAFSPDGRRLATASRDATAALWDATKGVSSGDAMQHGASVNAVAFSPDGRRVATASDDGSARLWSAATGQPLSEPLWHAEAVTGLVFSPDERTLFSASGQEIRGWEIATRLETADRKYLARLARALSTAQAEPSGRISPHVAEPLRALQAIATNARATTTFREWFFAEPAPER